MKKPALALAFILAAGCAFAADCPVKDGGDDYLDRVGVAVEATTSCETAASLAQACALGGSGDGFMVGFAEKKCGLDFRQKLSSADKRIYSRLLSRCAAKYKGMKGTAYISDAAFCRLQVARLFADLYSPAR
jgi:hypothetical protein